MNLFKYKIIDVNSETNLISDLYRIGWLQI